MRRFDGLIFDIGDILHDASLWRRWLTGRLQELDVAITCPQLVAKWEALLVDVYCGRADYWERFRELLINENLNASQVDELTKAACQKAVEVQKDRQPMPGVPETLAKLKRDGVKLVALSDSENGEEEVRKALRQLGIESFFDAVVTSKDIGHAKPAPEAFQAAIKATGLPMSRCAFVGHDIDELQGAQEVGLFAIGYNYHSEAPADVYIEAFSELQDVVEGRKSS